MLKEITFQKDYLAAGPVHTIYFGGGTPSLLKASELHSLLAHVYATFPVAANAEITLEANPDDLTTEKLSMLKAAGVNRLSIGIQSFHDLDLTWMNRAHNSRQALKSIHAAQEIGFQNITIDLIYGGPTLTDSGWEHNVKQAIALNIPHISCYALTVEPGTALDHFIKKKKMAPADADKAAHHFEMLLQLLEDAGYEHYEISNFAMPGWHSQHNSSYWQGQSYLGIGPAAHSFNGSSRQWNVANNTQYIKSITKDAIPCERELLTTTMQFNEYIMTALRTSTGCNLEWITERFGASYKQHLLENSQSFIAMGQVEQVTETLRLTKTGKLFADGIAGSLFI